MYTDNTLKGMFCMDIRQILTPLAAAFGPPGQESAVADAVESLIAPYVDEIRRDTLGNLIARRKGTGKRVLFSAHMDGVGFIVTHIDKNGFLRFGAMGGISALLSLGSRVKFRNDTRGIVCADGNYAKNKALSDLYIDIGAASEGDARRLVAVGDAAVFDQPVTMQGDALISPYLDDRMGCAVLIAALAEAPQTDNDLYFVFSAQEELGARGARTAAYGVEPDYAFSIDVTQASDTPEFTPKAECRLGGGAAVHLMDANMIAHPKISSFLFTAAEKEGIRVQRQVLRIGGTDAGPIHRSRSGVPSGVIAIPTRYVHSPQEMCYLSDAEECVKLTRRAMDIKI
jgi:endoglucanase